MHSFAWASLAIGSIGLASIGTVLVANGSWVVPWYIGAQFLSMVLVVHAYKRAHEDGMVDGYAAGRLDEMAWQTDVQIGRSDD